MRYIKIARVALRDKPQLLEKLSSPESGAQEGRADKGGEGG
jgi:hypothetical protein